MASSVDVNVTGLREVVRALERFGVEVTDLRPGFARIGAMVAAEARSLNRDVSGDLDRSIKPTTSYGRATITAGGPAAPYAGVIHYGGGVGPHARGPHNIKPNPFLAKAAESKAGSVADALDREIDRLLRSTGLS